jgi:Outer membrane protein/protective antigen OMA87
VVAYYRDQGYLRANVGVPELKEVADSSDKKTRWVELRVPVTEGPRYKVGSSTWPGIRREVRVPETALQNAARRVLRREADPQGTREGTRDLRHRRLLRVHGFPDYKFHDDPNPNEPEAPESLRAPEAPKAKGEAPIVDVTMRMQEGQQFFVNRITFTGNTTTRDNVIRREMRLLEDAPFNTEALKFSVKRLNQLGTSKRSRANPARSTSRRCRTRPTRSTSS